MMTRRNYSVPDKMVADYFAQLVNKFFKILPIKENGEPSLNEYLLSLQIEMLGLRGLMILIHNDSMYLSLLAILEYLIENDVDVRVVRREVFKAISICNKLEKKYTSKGGDDSVGMG